MKVDIALLEKDIEPILMKAGEILLSYFNCSFTIHTKENGSIATTADIECEKFLKSKLGALIPGVSFYAEESGKEGDSPYCFVIDPLDGTTNFSRGIAYFCISVCLTYNDEPLLGVIYQPVLNEYFVAVQGKGAYFNGKRLQLDDSLALSESLTVVGLPYTKSDFYRMLVTRTQKIAPASFAFRSFGASALDLAYVALGRINGVYLADLAWWDIAAGILLIKEAGGEASDFQGGVLTPTFKTCLAGSKKVYNQLKELLSLAK